MASPRIIMLDEPFGAPDAQTRQQMQNELLRIRERERITTLLVTHDFHRLRQQLIAQLGAA